MGEEVVRGRELFAAVVVHDDRVGARPRRGTRNTSAVPSPCRDSPRSRSGLFEPWASRPTGLTAQAREVSLTCP
jgi:hypothetical protein